MSNITFAEDLTKSSFKQIIPYDNYEINGEGIIRNIKTGRILKKNSSCGYFNYTLSKDGVIKTYGIHHLLALCFIPNEDNKKCVDHLDRNKQNNNIENLRWVTYSENLKNRKSWTRKKKSIITTELIETN